MKINRLLKLIFLLITICSYSQETELNYSYFWNGEENYDAMIGTESCPVRENPSIDSALLDSLQLGKEIKVIYQTDKTLKLKGINANWVYIEYKNSVGALIKGYLWKGFLAVGYTKKSGKIYLTTIDKIETKKEEEYDVKIFHITAKLLDSNKKLLIQKTIQKNIGVESIYFENEAIGGLGLKNIQDIYRISFSGEACALPSFYFYFGWNGQKFIELPEKFEVSDAGAYYHFEKFIFPQEKGGKPNLIIKKIKEGENIDETGEKMIYNVIESKEIYQWSGEKATLIKKEKSKPYMKTL